MALPSVSEAQERFWSALPKPVGRGEAIPLSAAPGRVTAEAVCAAADVPPFDRSVVDGYALRAADARPGARLRLVGEIRMGHAAAGRVDAGTCIAIPTGGMLPEGADTVIMIEETERSDGSVALRAGIEAGRNLVHRGDDVRAGAVLVPAGKRLRPADIGALAGIGITQVSVYAKPRVALLSSGDEIVPPDEEPVGGQVRDMNSWSVAAAVERDGGEPLRLGIIRDTAEAVREALASALARADAVLVSGGSSVGERDFIPATLDSLGKPGLLLHGIAVKPGKPTGLAVIDGKVAVALPGHPVSALVMYELLVSHALKRLGGETRPPRRGFVEATLSEAVPAPKDRDFYCRVALDGDRAIPVEGGSALLSTMVKADGLLFVARGTRHEAGETVRVEVLN